MSRRETDEQYMSRAIELARRASSMGEVPVGAVLVQAGKIVGEGFNQSISNHDPCGHAEIGALQSAGRRVRNYRLPGSTLYVTMEPCIMCAGAIVHARVQRLVFSVHDARSGAAGSLVNLVQSGFLNHQCTVESGILREESLKLIQDFFRSRR
ncbi:MAG: tRNA adenosine(34) deaminase TadA [Gammaproteobacteria bacterium]|nr:tRNA adenosine(34) deaminase TadA [Gammaproteobacteria bacterium]